MFFKSQYRTKKNNRFILFYNQFKQVINQESWLLVFLSTIWLAGPVTYLSLQIGYYVGYGKIAPTETFIYFAIYTVITTIFAIFSRVFNNAILIPKKQKKQQLLDDTINRLFMIYFSARNTHLKSYSQDDRYIIAAWWHVSSSSTDNADLQELIHKISGDYELSQLIRRIDYYRSQGFHALIKDEIELYKDKIEQFTENLSNRFPAFANYIHNRFHGIAPSLNTGHHRPLGFIERLSMVLEKSNSDHATGDDMLSMLHFAIELLLGRSIKTIYPRFNGLEKLEEARQDFDKNLSDFRVALRKRNGKIINLIIDLLDGNIHENDAYFFTRNAKTQDLVNFMLKTLAKVPNNSFKIQKRYEDICKLNQSVHNHWLIASKKEKKYNRIWHKDSETLKEKLSNSQKVNSKNSFLFLDEYEIQLNANQRLECAENILEIIDNIIVQRKNLKALALSNDFSEELTEDDYKMIAAQIGNIFDEILNISEPEEQIAIEASKACDLGAITPTQPWLIKLNLANIAVNEITSNRSEIAHRMASFLVQYLNISLGDHIIDFLVDEYSASRDFLRELQIENDDTNKILTTQIAQSELVNLPNWGYDLKQYVND